jgi:hypothetical protein
VDESRHRLGLLQAKLVAALTLAGAPPVDMDPQRVAASARQLALKRLRAVRRAWPSLHHLLGADFETVGLAVLAGFPMAERYHAVADGLAIAEHCCDLDQMNDAVCIALLHCRAHWTLRAGFVRPRKWPWLGMARLPDSHRLAVAARLMRTGIWILGRGPN